MVSFNLLDLTLPSPLENLALHEALLEGLEENESPRPIGKPNVGLSLLDGSQKGAGMNWSAFAWIKLRAQNSVRTMVMSSSGHNKLGEVVTVTEIVARDLVARGKAEGVL